MFPSINSNGDNDPVSYIDHSILHKHFSIDTIPNSKQEDLPLSFFNLPSPYYYNQCELELGDHDLFLHHQNLMPDHSRNEESTIDCSKKCHNSTDRKIPRKRSYSKADRHSKINTAKGPRDRRMRLSLDVAREFFGLQDMLGYDKASRTVEWLLIQAKPEIKKLAGSQLSQLENHSCSVEAARSTSSASEGEVVSGIDKAAAIEGSVSKGKSLTKQKKVRQPRKNTFRPLARYLREKARARAKARTKAKILLTQRFDESKLCNATRNNDPTELNSWSSFETGEEFVIHNRNNPSLQAAIVEVKELSSCDREHIRINGDLANESLQVMCKCNPNSIFNCLQNAGIYKEGSTQRLSVLWQNGKPS